MSVRSPARYLAPTALVACTVVVAAVLASSPGSSHRGGAPVSALRSAHRRHRHHRYYIVRRGDSLSQVAVRTGVALSRLEQLNPRIVPNALHPGQRIRLGP